MQIIILRAATALLIAISASTGIQATSNPSAQSQIQATASPAVLSAEIQVEAKQTPEASASATPIASASAELNPTPNIEPQAQATPVPEEVLISEEMKQKEKQEKVLRLQAYLKKHNSPMTNNAQDFVDAAEQYNLDWKLVPSIAGVESTFGKFLIKDSYNAYGWGGGTIRFESWRDGIYTVSKGLSEKYVKRGLITPYQMQQVYAPPSSTWGGKVTYFMAQIEAQPLEPQQDK